MVRYGYLLLVGFASIFSLCPAKAQSQFNYEHPVELTGKIEFKTYTDNGAPYFGEGKSPYPPYGTAPNVKIMVFVPDKPIDVIATAHSGPDQESYYGIENIEIFNADLDTAKKYLDAHVKVRGILSERERGFEYTDVLITANKISAIQ